MNLNMNNNYQQSPNQPHINYDAVDKMQMQQVQQTMDANKFGKTKAKRSGSSDWKTLAIALVVIVVVVAAVLIIR